MHVLDANEIFWMTFYTFDRIMEAWGKNWPDAVALYIRLLKQSRIQETNQTWSLNEFLQQSMGRWREKLQTAKKILNGLWLIDYVQLKSERGKFWTQLIRVNYLIDEQKVRTNSISYELLVDRLPTKPSADKTTTNTYIHNINALNTQNKYSPENLDEHTIEYIYSNYYWKWKGIDEKKCNKLIEDKLKQWITLEDIQKSITLYNCECRIKQDYQYVKKLETWLKEFQPLSEEQIEETLYTVVKEYSKKKKSDEKFASSKPAKTLWSDLKETFGEERVKSMFKQANSSCIQLTFK